MNFRNFDLRLRSRRFLHSGTDFDSVEFDGFFGRVTLVGDAFFGFIGFTDFSVRFRVFRFEIFLVFR